MNVVSDALLEVYCANKQFLTFHCCKFLEQLLK